MSDITWQEFEAQYDQPWTDLRDVARQALSTIADPQRCTCDFASLSGYDPECPAHADPRGMNDSTTSRYL